MGISKSFGTFPKTVIIRIRVMNFTKAPYHAKSIPYHGNLYKDETGTRLILGWLFFDMIFRY